MTEPDAPHVLVTGATGLVGSAVVLELLSRGQPVLAIARGSNDEEAQVRIEEALAGEQPADPCLVSRAGDLLEPCLGLALDRLPPVGAFVHAAADTSFSGLDGGEVVNLDGTLAALELAVALGVERFHHVSTAFIAGDAHRFGPEDFDVGQSFRNEYERTKFEAEAVLRRRDWPFGITIHRPGVVLGDSRTGRTPTYRGLYGLLRVVVQAVDALPAGEPAHLSAGADPEGLRHLLTADDLAHAIAGSVADADAPALLTLHHVPERPHTNSTMARMLEEILDTSGMIAARDAPTSAELTDALEPFAAYLDGDPVFEPSAAGARAGVGLEAMRRIIDHGRRARWRAPRRRRVAAGARGEQILRRYFDEVLAPRLGLELLEGVRSKTACFLVELAGDPRACLAIDIQAGVLVRLLWQPGSELERDFVARLELPRFLDLAAAHVDPRECFFAGKIEVEGDVERALELALLMRQFFASSPWQPRPGEMGKHRVGEASGADIS